MQVETYCIIKVCKEEPYVIFMAEEKGWSWLWSVQSLLNFKEIDIFEDELSA